MQLEPPIMERLIRSARRDLQVLMVSPSNAIRHALKLPPNLPGGKREGCGRKPKEAA